jgi:hypothetical protein
MTQNLALLLLLLLAAAAAAAVFAGPAAVSLPAAGLRSHSAETAPAGATPAGANNTAQK